MLQNLGHEPNMHMLFFMFPVHILFYKSTEGNAEGGLISHHSELTVACHHYVERRFRRTGREQQTPHPDC
jgi:hypothetical protein